MLCFVALVFIPSFSPTSSIDIPSTWRSVKAARSRAVSRPSASLTRSRDLRAGRDPLRRRLRLGAALAERTLLEVDRVVRILAMAAAANQVDRTVHGDPVQPGPKIRPGLEPAQLLVRLEPRLLHHVLRVLRIAGHPVRQRKDVAGMVIDERSKRIAVAIAGLGDH